MDAPTVEFSRPVALEEVRGGTVHRSIEATEQERVALAGRFGLQAIDRLTAQATLDMREGGRIVAVSGEFAADVTQTCVITLEPVVAHLEETFTSRLAVEPEQPADSIIDLDLEAEEPEPIEGDSIDIGELVAQHLSLALDPYPRRPGARYEPETTTEARQDSPFAALGRLKPRR